MLPDGRPKEPLSRLTRLAVIACAFALPLGAQNAPPPSPAAFPFTGYVGRYLDSSSSNTYYLPYRVLRAGRIKLDRAHDRIYMIAGGETFAGYALSRFISRIGSPYATGAFGEKYLSFDVSVTPDAPGSGWQTYLADGTGRLADFDFDDRGYIYLAYSIWGWGIVDLQGSLVTQSTSPAPTVILTTSFSGQQYAIVSNGQSATTIYDVTDPHAPAVIGTLPFGIARYAKNAAGDAVAILPYDGSSVRIYTPAELISNGAPLEIQPNTTVPFTTFKFRQITTDGVNFYALQEGVDTSQTNTSHSIMSTISPSGAGYTSAEWPMLTNIVTSELSFESGWLVWTGGPFASTYAPGGQLYRFNGTGFDPAYDISSFLQPNYPTPWPTAPQIIPFCTDSGAFALFPESAVGDVFSLAPAVWGCMPGAPTGASATADDGTATVSFVPPASDSGSPVTSYVVTSNPGGITATGASSPVTVSGLTNGVTYTFTVAAINAIGRGPESLPSNAATPAATLLPPAQMLATAHGASVDIAWSAAGKAVRYDILRSASIAGPFEPVGSTAGLSYVDNSAPANATSLYAIRSIDGGDAQSAAGPIDPATTVPFTDEPLAPGVTALAVHMIELRTAVNAMRTAAGLAGAAFTDPTLDSNVAIKAVHISELRAALDEARAALGLPPLSYTDPTITPGETYMKAVHVHELRDAVK